MKCETNPYQVECADHDCDHCWHGGMMAALGQGSLAEMKKLGRNPLHWTGIDQNFIDRCDDATRKLCKERWPYWNNVTGWNPKIQRLISNHEE